MMSWRVALLLAVGVGLCTGESFLSRLDASLRKELSGVLQTVHVDYYKPVLNLTLLSSTEFDMRGMGTLYNSTPIAIDVIARKDAYPEGMVTVVDYNIEFANFGDNWQKLLSHYAGPVAVIVVIVLLIVALPLAGLFWCCCHMCRFNRRRRPFDRKYDACLKGLLAIMLIGLLTLFLFGVVCAFATDEHLDTNTRTLPESVHKASADLREYLNVTQAHSHWLLVVNYKQLQDKLNDMLNNSGVKISDQLGEFSKAVSVTTLHKMVQQLDSVHADLKTVHTVTGGLRYNAERLNSGLRKVKAQLLKTLASCEQPQCRRLQEKYKIGQLDTEIQYSQMPDVSELLNNVTMLLDSDIKKEVAEGHKVFTDIQHGIQNSVQENIPTVKQALEETGDLLRNVSRNITEITNYVSQQVKFDENTNSYKEIDDIIQEYATYRRYVGLGVAVALLIIMCFLTLGLICGVCGKRPDVYGASDCCNKGAGTKWMLCGMGITFLFGSIVCCVLLVYFVVGVVGQRFVCDPLTEPQGNRVFSVLEEFVDLEQIVFHERKDPNYNLTAVITRCHRNKTLYETLHLERLIDLDIIQQDVERKVGRKIESLKPQYPVTAKNVLILKPAAKVKLRQLADTGLSEFNFDRILQALETNITSLALDSLASQLEATATELTGRPGFATVTMELRDAAAMLNAYQRDIVQPMLSDTATLSDVALSLRDGLRFNHSSLKEAVTHLLQETQDAEAFLNTQGPALIHNLTQDFAEKVAASIAEYLQLVVTAAKQDVGRCGPISKTYNATLNATCRKILMPVNGYWISIAWCVLLMVPILVVAQKLARLYLHVDPYPGPLVEAEYLYDAYADRDNVPLANAYKAEKRSRRETRGAGGGGEGSRGGGEGSRGGARGDVAEVAAPALDAHHSRRYNDMAPKHWEEGPPRYHGPTEYERPPPYYYPGPNDRQ